MTGFVDVCAYADIANGKHRAFTLHGKPILIFRINSDLYAIENRCSHMDWPLDGGRQVGCTIICRSHGARFDIRTGKVLGGPAVDAVQRFEVRKREDRIEVQI